MWPILFRLGPVTIYSFGVALAISLLAGSFLVWRQARKLGLSEEKVLDLLFLTILVSLFLSRIGFVYSHWAMFSPDWSRIVLVGKYSGLSFTTGLVSGVIVSGFLARNSRLAVLLVWDIVSLAMSFALVPGLFGCFLDGCAGGVPVYTSLILAIIGLVWWAGLMFLARIMSKSSALAEISKRHGLFFLGYLIFQTISLLMLTSGINLNNFQAISYLLVLSLLILLFVIRYWQLFRFLYDSVSQKRSGTNNHLS